MSTSHHCTWQHSAFGVFLRRTVQIRPLDALARQPYTPAEADMHGLLSWLFFEVIILFSVFLSFINISHGKDLLPTVYATLQVAKLLEAPYGLVRK
jgi:hypothetical protein